MKCLAMMAHGSRNQSANEELVALADETHKTLGSHYDNVDACYLELATPSLTQLCEHWIDSGAQSIDIYPLFLNSGRHASKDIPQEVDTLRQAHPKIVFTLLPYLGQNPLFATIVSDHIRSNTH